MNLREKFIRGLILPVLFAAALPGSGAAALVTRAYTYSGTVANLCRIGSSTSYSISISEVGTSNMTTTITLDGVTGNPQSQNNQNATVTVNYAAICNRTAQQTLILTAPTAAKSGGGTLAYTIQIFNAANAGGTQVASISTEPGTANVVIPAQTSATWSIKITVLNKNSTPAGTYTATATIQ